MRTTALVIALVVVLFAYFVWPTPWQYLSHQFLATRVHRATGHAQVLTGDGWRAVGTDYVTAMSENAMRELQHDRLESQLINRDWRHSPARSRRAEHRAGASPGNQEATPGYAGANASQREDGS
ncbi:MAG: hypothetical protein JSV79_04425 [Armatimonadota bacterium]|nr:MAG: hypothetical protein JSV79_04425 [Armatimonadota bacterium]